eukprot:7636924-Pyramimonas_sp.AAC.1
MIGVPGALPSVAGGEFVSNVTALWSLRRTYITCCNLFRPREENCHVLRPAGANGESLPHVIITWAKATISII